MAKQYKISDFEDREVQACQRVLVEVLNLLRAHADHIALIGGWVPFYLMKDNVPAHIGSLDVDLCFDHANISDTTYDSITEILKDNGYSQDETKNLQFQWLKDIKIDSGEPVTVKLDLLATELHGSTQKHRHQQIQDAKARKARGSDLIFENNGRYETVEIEGVLPNGALDTVVCKVAAPEPFIVMKGLAIGRGKRKDAYDIEYVIANYPGGVNALIKEFRQLIELPIVRESLGRIRTKFESVNHAGPIDVVDFLGIYDVEERELRQRRAFENVRELLDALKVEKVVG